VAWFHTEKPGDVLTAGIDRSYGRADAGGKGRTTGQWRKDRARVDPVWDDPAWSRPTGRLRWRLIPFPDDADAAVRVW